MKRVICISWRDKQHPEAGGAEEYITQVLEKLALDGNEVIMLTSSYSGAPQKEVVNNVNYIRYGNKFSIYVLLPLFYLLKYRRTGDILIESYNAFPFFGPLLAQRNATVIYHIQKEEWVQEFGQILGKLLQNIVSFFVSIAYRDSPIITISESSRQDILKILPENLVQIFPVGIPKRIFQPLEEKSSSPISLISIGRLKAHKRVDLALQAIAQVIPHLQVPITFHIVGKGEEEERLKVLCQTLGITGSVIFHGYVSEEEKQRLLQNAHLHLQFSKREGWGITVIEAAQYKVPTICFEVPGLKDSVTKETGYIFSSESEMQLELPKIISSAAIKEKNYLNKSEESLKWSTHFTWDSILAKWSEFIGQI